MTKLLNSDWLIRGVQLPLLIVFRSSLFSTINKSGECVKVLNGARFNRGAIFFSQSKGPYRPDAIRQRDAIFRFSLTDNFDSNLNFPNI